MAEKEKPPKLAVVRSDDFPDVYAEQVAIGVGVYGVSLTFGVIDDDPADPRPIARIRMSPQHAFVLCQMLRKNLKRYEEEIGKINLPDGLFSELKIDKEL